MYKFAYVRFVTTMSHFKPQEFLKSTVSLYKYMETLKIPLEPLETTRSPKDLEQLTRSPYDTLETPKSPKNV